MLTGKALGQAVAHAIALKGVSKAAVARHFEIKPPSISDWCNSGTIDKRHLEKLFAYFSDVVEMEHWGIVSGFSNPQEPSAAGISQEDIDFLRALHTLRPARQAAIRATTLDEADQLAHNYPPPNTAPTSKKVRR